MEQKKVLLISMTCGEGHNNIAKAIASELQNQGATTKIADIYESDKRKLKNNNE